MALFNEWRFHLAWSIRNKTTQRGVLETGCHLPIPSIDLLLLYGWPVELSPGPHVVQPGQHLLGAPAGHRLTDEYVVLVLLPTAAPVVHQQHHLPKHKQARFKRGTQRQVSVSKLGFGLFFLFFFSKPHDGRRWHQWMQKSFEIKSLLSLTFPSFCKS